MIPALKWTSFKLRTTRCGLRVGHPGTRRLLLHPLTPGPGGFTASKRFNNTVSSEGLALEAFGCRHCLDCQDKAPDGCSSSQGQASRSGGPQEACCPRLCHLPLPSLCFLRRAVAPPPSSAVSDQHRPLFAHLIFPSDQCCSCPTLLSSMPVLS